MRDIIMFIMMVMIILLFFMLWMQHEYTSDLDDKITRYKSGIEASRVKNLAYLQKMLLETNESNTEIFDAITEEINYIHANKLSREDISLTIEALVKLYTEEYDER